MSAEISRDLREYVRIQREHIVGCKKIVVPVKGDPEVAYQQVTNIQAGGLLMASNEMYGIDSLLRLTITVPDWEELIEHRIVNGQLSLIVAIVRVVFVELCTDNTYDIGMQLLGIRGSHQMGLVHYINENVKEAC